MKSLKQYTFLIVILGLFFNTIQAQTAKQDLEKGIEILNVLKDYSKDFTSQNITDANVKEVESRNEKALVLFNKAAASGTADEIKAAKYFKTNTRYKLGTVYAAKGRNKDAMSVLKEIETDMNGYTEPIFPIKYALLDKKLQVNFKEFAATQNEFYGLMGQILMDAGKKTEALVYLQKTIKSSYATNLVKFSAYNKLLTEKKKDAKFDKEMLDWSYAMMEQYDMLSEDQKKVLKDNGSANYTAAAGFFKAALEKIPLSVEKANICSKAALFIAKYIDVVKEPAAEKRKQNGEYAKVWFKTAIDDGKDDRQMLEEALKVAKTLEGNKSEFGKSVLDKIASKLFPTQCEGFNKVADEYTYFGNTKKANEYKNKSEDCRAKQEVEAKRLAEERRKEQEVLEKERKRLSRESHFFVGTQVVPLFFKGYGGVMNIGAQNTLFEASFLHLSNKKETFFDLQMKNVKDVPEHRWNGFFAHIAYKGANRNGSTKTKKIYTGFLLGYNQRTFDTFSSEVMNTSDSKKVVKTFSPTTKQYLLMVNCGMMLLKKWGVDVFGGVGATYNKFDGGNAEVWNKTGYKITDKMVANRKPTYFGFTGRVGISIGFGW
jgi:hypothetical protein